MKFSVSILTTVLALSSNVLAIPANTNQASNGRNLNSRNTPKSTTSRRDLAQLLSKGLKGVKKSGVPDSKASYPEPTSTSGYYFSTVTSSYNSYPTETSSSSYEYEAEDELADVLFGLFYLFEGLSELACEAGLGDYCSSS
ncbi:hypothetical protein F5Y18DRAFT_366860 [Xylariaceae sp. FL1019]|nr:hypothetical protein F5Y18DRAFT_366860 [Xylariaceae sp. FL1019]